MSSNDRKGKGISLIHTFYAISVALEKMSLVIRHYLHGKIRKGFEIKNVDEEMLKIFFIIDIFYVSINVRKSLFRQV